MAHKGLIYKGGSSTKNAVLVDGEGERMAKAAKDGEGWTFQQKTAACKAPEPKRSGAQKQSAIKYRYPFTASLTAAGPAA